MIAEIMNKMIAFSEGNLHDIDHFIKVWTYAKTIAELESVSDDEKFILETAAIVHDIACPSLRERLGHSDGKLQEIEGPPIAKELLEDFPLTDSQLERVLFLVAHHHTYDNIKGIDYQILIEADYIVNAGESGYTEENIRNTYSSIFKTESGKTLLKGIYLI